MAWLKISRAVTVPGTGPDIEERFDFSIAALMSLEGAFIAEHLEGQAADKSDKDIEKSKIFHATGELRAEVCEQMGDRGLPCRR